MVQFAEAFPDEQIVAALLRQLGWTHFVLLLPIKDPLKRDFYAHLCRVERWSTRALEKKLDSMLFERTAISRKPANLILRDMESFLLELGVGFAFLERQKRITVDGDDYYLDLLFFHRELHRLVAIELKIGDFKPAFKGQMELYLRWLNQYERREGEESPIGLILCAGKKEETIRLLDMEGSGIRVASYWTDVLPREQLQRKLHEAVVLARQRLAGQASDHDLLSGGDR